MSEPGGSLPPEAASHKTFGWADDIIAPRQEIDTLSLLHDEASIQKILDSSHLTPGDFLKKYREARNAHRSAPPSQDLDPGRPTQFAEELAVFGAHASSQAQRQSRNRSVLICSGPDGPGGLAALAETVADEGSDIMGAFMSVIAGHLVTALLLSGAALGRAAVQQRLGEATEQEPREIQIVSRPLPGSETDWPRSGSSCWHASARFRGEALLLLELTGAIRKHKISLVAVSSWQEADGDESGEPLQVVDLNFAVAPARKGEDLRIIRDIEAEVAQILPTVRLHIVPVTWPTRSRPPGILEPPTRKEAVMTVVGHARPGFVADVLGTLVQQVEAVIEVRNASMAIIEGASILTIVFARANKPSLDELNRQIRTRLRAAMIAANEAPPVAVQIVKASKRASVAGGKVEQAICRDRPTHELSVIAVEQPGVVAKVARLLADLDVNITWFVSHVLEPVVGQRWPMCAIQMDLHVPKAGRKDIEMRLHTLRDIEGWQDATIHEWSLADSGTSARSPRDH